MNKNWVNEYKVYISRVYGERGDFPYLMIGKPFLGEPNTCCTETYIVIGPFSSKQRAENVIGKYFILYLRNLNIIPIRLRQMYTTIQLS